MVRDEDFRDEFMPAVEALLEAAAASSAPAARVAAVARALRPDASLTARIASADVQLAQAVVAACGGAIGAAYQAALAPAAEADAEGALSIARHVADAALRFTATDQSVLDATTAALARGVERAAPGEHDALRGAAGAAVAAHHACAWGSGLPSSSAEETRRLWAPVHAALHAAPVDTLRLSFADAVWVLEAYALARYVLPDEWRHPPAKAFAIAIGARGRFFTARNAAAALSALMLWHQAPAHRVHSLFSTAAEGIDTLPQPGTQAVQLLEAADACAYDASTGVGDTLRAAVAAHAGGVPPAIAASGLLVLARSAAHTAAGSSAAFDALTARVRGFAAEGALSLHQRVAALRGLNLAAADVPAELYARIEGDVAPALDADGVVSLLQALAGARGAPPSDAALRALVAAAARVAPDATPRQATDILAAAAQCGVAVPPDARQELATSVLVGAKAGCAPRDAVAAAAALAAHGVAIADEDRACDLADALTAAAPALSGPEAARTVAALARLQTAAMRETARATLAAAALVVLAPWKAPPVGDESVDVLDSTAARDAGRFFTLSSSECAEVRLACHLRAWAVLLSALCCNFTLTNARTSNVAVRCAAVRGATTAARAPRERGQPRCGRVAGVCVRALRHARSASHAPRRHAHRPGPALCAVAGAAARAQARACGGRAR